MIFNRIKHFQYYGVVFYAINARSGKVLTTLQALQLNIHNVVGILKGI